MSAKQHRFCSCLPTQRAANLLLGLQLGSFRLDNPRRELDELRQFPLLPLLLQLGTYVGQFLRFLCANPQIRPFYPSNTDLSPCCVSAEHSR